MERRLRPGSWALLAAALALAACSETPVSAPPDAGWIIPPDRDAGAEADSGPCDGCGADAGPPDAGPGDGGAHEVAITNLTPARGPVGGGTTVTVDGRGFFLGFADRSTAAKKDTRVFFGDNEASEFQVIDDDTLEVVAPPNAAGPVDVVVRNPNGVAPCRGCFTYFVELELASIAPTQGSTEGGTEVALTGYGFGPDLTVLFGSVVSPQVTFVDLANARAITPPASAPGPVDVRAFNKNGVGEIRRGFTYLAPLAVDRVEPAYGPTIGGDTVRIVGARLGDATGVDFGPSPATLLARIDDGTIEVLTPTAASPGPVDVAVTTPAGTAALAGGFVYFDDASTALGVVGVAPDHGPSAGGNRVAVVGAGLDAPGLTVEFGGAPVAAVVSLAPHAAVVEVPTGPANTRVNVSVADGVSSASLASAYQYNVRLDAVAPAAGAPAGGEVVVLSGAGFATGLEVLFGALKGTSLVLVDSTRLAVVTPPGAGPVDVAVRSVADRLNRAVLPAGFTYREPLSLGRIAPDTGAVAGGTYVTVMGTGFEAGVIATLNGLPLRDLLVLDAHVLVGRTPPGTVGPADVGVEKAAESDQLPGGFVYFDPKNGMGGSSGPPLGGTLNVTVLDSTPGIEGTPVAGARVMLGSDPTTPFQGGTDRRGQVTFSDPQLVKAQQVTVSKVGYEAITVARQESQNLTVYIGSNEGGSGSPGFLPAVPPSIISGRVTGFKPPRPLTAGEIALAEVWVAPSSLYYAAPVGYETTPDQRDGAGERWRVTSDGGTYTVLTDNGLKAVYARFGILNQATGVFTPVLLGIRRGVTADPDHPAVGQDIVLDMHLDQTVPVTIDNPQQDPDLGGPATNQVYVYIDLGGEGVIPMGATTSGAATFDVRGLPQLDGGAFTFLNLSSGSLGAPQTYCFRRQQGDASQGVTIGPMLGMLGVTQPSALGVFRGTVAWTVASGPSPDITQVIVGKLTLFGLTTYWSAIVPGTDRSITMPPTVLAQIQQAVTPEDTMIVEILTARSPRFDFDYWSYGQLYVDAWTSFGFHYAPLTMF